MIGFKNRRRDLVELMSDVLKGISKDLSTTRTMMHTRTNWAYVKRIISILVNKGLVEIKQGQHSGIRIKYSLTSKGVKLMELLSRIERIKEEHSLDNPHGQEIDIDELREEALSLARTVSIKKRRERTDIVFLIVCSLIDGPRTESSIARFAHVNTDQAYSYIDELLASGMIEKMHVDNKTKYSITSKGIEFIYLYVEIYKILYSHD